VEIQDDKKLVLVRSLDNYRQGFGKKLIDAFLKPSKMSLFKKNKSCLEAPKSL